MIFLFNWMILRFHVNFDGCLNLWDLTFGDDWSFPPCATTLQLFCIFACCCHLIFTSFPDTKIVGFQWQSNESSLNEIQILSHQRGKGSNKGVFRIYSWYSGKWPQRFNPLRRRIGTPLTFNNKNVTKHGHSTVNSSQLRKEAEQLRKMPHHMPTKEMISFENQNKGGYIYGKKLNVCWIM